MKVPFHPRSFHVIAILTIFVTLCSIAFYLLHQHSPRSPFYGTASSLSTSEALIIINVDTLRFDELGIYGNTRRLTPNLDRVSKGDGVIFNYAYAASDHTRPSVVSLLTGLYPTNHGFWHQLSNVKVTAPNIGTMAKPEYFTIFVSANPNTVDLFRSSFDRVWSEDPTENEQFRDCGYFPAEYLFQKAEQLIAEAGTPKKLLIYIQPADPHGPYYPLQQYDDLFIGDDLRTVLTGRFGSYLADLRWDDDLGKRTPNEIRNLRNRYDAEVRYLDAQVDRFLTFISRIYAKRLTIFTSDHGESFLDHNDAGHGSSLYDEQVHIPFIVIDTERRFGNPSRSNLLVSSVDVMPTLSDLLGRSAPLKTDGHSILQSLMISKKLFPLIKRRVIGSEVVHSSQIYDFEAHFKQSDSRTKTFIEYLKSHPLNVLIRATIESVEFGPWIHINKYIENKDIEATHILLRLPGFHFQPHIAQLYRIDIDPKEQNNLIKAPGDTALSKRSPLDGVYPEFHHNALPLDQEQKERLKALGYIK